MRLFISILILAAVILTLFKSETMMPFLTDGVTPLKAYRDFAERKEFSSICWVRCGGATFTGGIIGYKEDYAIVLTTGHGFQNILQHTLSDDRITPKNFSPVIKMRSNTCVIGFGEISEYEKSFPVSHVILNTHYVRAFDATEPQSDTRSHDYALMVVHMTKKDQKKHRPLVLPKETIHSITPAQFCGYGTGDKNKRAFGLFGGEHETIFPNLRKAMLVYPFFDPSVGALEDNLVKEWEGLGKFPTGRAEPGDSGAPILVKQDNGQFITVGVVQGIQFQGDPKALKTASIKEQFENVSTAVAPIVVLKKDGLYHLSKTFKEMLDTAYTLSQEKLSLGK